MNSTVGIIKLSRRTIRAASFVNEGSKSSKRIGVSFEKRIKEGNNEILQSVKSTSIGKRGFYKEEEIKGQISREGNFDLSVQRGRRRNVDRALLRDHRESEGGTKNSRVHIRVRPTPGAANSISGTSCRTIFASSSIFTISAQRISNTAGSRSVTSARILTSSTTDLDSVSNNFDQVLDSRGIRRSKENLVNSVQIRKGDIHTEIRGEITNNNTISAAREPIKGSLEAPISQRYSVGSFLGRIIDNNGAQRI